MGFQEIGKTVAPCITLVLSCILLNWKPTLTSMGKGWADYDLSRYILRHHIFICHVGRRIYQKLVQFIHLFVNLNARKYLYKRRQVSCSHRGGFINQNIKETCRLNECWVVNQKTRITF